jgi:3-hydroxymyristoyl/3-hydroxydecanoyl-(acyl carrier protein) dehydratase
MSLIILPKPIDILPHRPPFLFLDEVTCCENQHVEASFLFKEDLAFFKGHFPEYPVVPGVILIEAMAQAVAYWALMKNPKHLVLLTHIDECKISHSVFPNQLVQYIIEIEKEKLGLVMANAKAVCENQTLATAKIKGFLKDRPHPTKER